MSYLCLKCSLHIFRSVDSLDASICAEIRTRIPDTVAWDYNFEPAGTNPLTFTVKVCHKILLTACQCSLNNDLVSFGCPWIFLMYLHIPRHLRVLLQNFGFNVINDGNWTKNIKENNIYGSKSFNHYITGY